MKRKFVSALLLMTLSAASVGMLVSCKDYDDDISGLRDDVSTLRTDLETAKSDLESQLTDVQGSFDTQIQAAVEGKAEQSYVDDLNTQRIAAESKLQEQIDAINEALENLGNGDTSDAEATLAAITGRVEDLEDKVAAVETNLQIQQDALASFLEAIQGQGFENEEELVAAVKQAQEDIATIQAAVSASSGDISTLKEQMANAETSLASLNSVVSGLQGQIDALTVYIDKMLSSLVFAPDFYYGGIAAMEATTINYTPVVLDNNSTLNNPLKDGETWKSASEDNSLTPDIVAKYHMNPSFFDVTRIKSMSVISDDKEYIQLGDTRTAESAPTVVDNSWLNSTDGMLSVTLNLDASKIKDDTEHVTVLAVQAHMNDSEGNDTTVTSDYAAVAKSTISDVVIADKEVEGTSCTANKKLHIYTTAKEAIDNDPTHTIIYDDTEGVDLKSLVQAHFVRNGAENETTTDDVEKYGMKWNFSESHYISGSNETSESAHIYIENNHAIACTVDADGNPQKGQQGRSSLDRMPMVRVELVDTTKTSNNIVAVGFIKFIIDEEEAGPTDAENITFNGNGYELSCTDYTYTQTWAQVEAQVLDKLGMSKAEFEANYEVEKLSTGSNECQLYNRDDEGNPVQSSQYGKITEIENDANHETTVLSWTIGDDEIYTAVWDASDEAYKTGVNLETGVRFVSKNSSKGDVYVWFNTGTITVPTATLDNSDKIKENWAAANSSMGSGYAEIHNNVEVVDQTGAADRFSQDILRTFQGNDITLNVTGSDDFKSSLTYTFKFIISDSYATQTGQSGNVYTMSVSADGQTLYANNSGTEEAIAKLGTAFDGVTSADGINSVVQYQHGEFAEDLLNAVSHNDLANTATATVGIYAENGCGMQLPISNNTFDIKFLRPLDATGAGEVVFTDAKTGGNQKDMADLVNFNDWRDEWDESWVTYYGVESIVANTADITTTLNGGTLGSTKLSDVTEGIKFNYVATGATNTYGGKDYGYLSYENNGSVTATFKIRVPLTITYDWGEITTAYVDITVEPTQAND